MIRLLFSRRIGNLSGFLACAGMLAFGYYLQFAVGLEPCPLCILQRIMLLATGIAFLVAAIHHPAGRIGAGIYAGAIVLCAVVGAAISARHTWIQHLPEDQRPACGPSLDFMLSTFGPVQSLANQLLGEQSLHVARLVRLIELLQPSLQAPEHAAVRMGALDGRPDVGPTPMRRGDVSAREIQMTADAQAVEVALRAPHHGLAQGHVSADPDVDEHRVASQVREVQPERACAAAAEVRRPANTVISSAFPKSTSPTLQ